MAVYRPDDPLNWLGISLSQQGVDEQGRTIYNLPDMGLDPEYIAYLTQYDQGRTTANADATLRRTQARDLYDQALRDLERQGLVTARDTDTSLLGRGMFQAGERQVRQEDLRRTLTEGRERADTTLAGQLGSIDSDLQRALGQLDSERERQIVASQARISDAQRQGAIDAGVYGGNNGGNNGTSTSGSSSRTQSPAAPPAPPSQRPSQQPVYDSIRQPTGPATSTRPASATTRPATATRPRTYPTVVRY